MKTIFAIFFLLFSCLLVLLATVDLEPFFQKEGTESSSNVQINSSTNKKDEPSAEATVSEQTVTPAPEALDEKQHMSQAPAAEIIPKNELDLHTPDQATERIEAKNIQPAEHQILTADNTNQGAETYRTEMIQGEKGQDLEVMVVAEDDFPYSVLLATFIQQSIAEKAIPLYRRQNISTHWVKVQLAEDNIHYRLFTGAFRTKDETRQYIEKKQLTDGLIKTTRYAARIGIFRDKTTLANTYTKVKEAGSIPYILATQEGVFHLYTGAYYTFEGASNQCDLLVQQGLSCQPITRTTLP